MEVNKERVPVEELKIGMYVAELDRPWLESPFLFQGFPIRNYDEIDKLRECCDYVYIDLEQSRNWQPEEHSRLEQEEKSDSDYDDYPKLEAGEHRFETRQVNVKSIHGKAEYHNTTSFVEELKTAIKVYHNARSYISEVLEDVRLGRSIDPEGARELANQMADSIVKNENALVWLTMLKKRDEYTSLHSINVCIMSLLFGRHLGLNMQELRLLGFGALMHDIGKMKVPLEVLNKPGRLTDEEMTLLKGHPVFGREILLESKDVPPVVVDVAYSHHERVDGSGYPRGLSGEQIGREAMIVSVVDVYDAITSDRVYHLGISPHEALNLMYGWAPKSFRKDLLEEFIKCLGIYPIGSIVELSSGEIGVVMTVNRKRHLWPIVTLVLDKDKQPYPRRKMINLDLLQRTGSTVNIRKILESKAFGIDVRSVIMGGGEASAATA